MKTHRLLVPALAFASLLAAAGCSTLVDYGEGITLRLALNQTETHPSYIALTDFGEKLAEGTDETLTLDVYPNETLGAQQEAIQMVSNGSVDMAVVSGTQLENLNDDFLVLNLPGMFQTIPEQMAAITDAEVQERLFRSLEETQHITVLGGFTQGARSIYASKPIETPEDLAGMKIRVQESDLHIGMINAMGGTGTPLSYGEVYTGMQSGVIDGAENNEVSYATQRHFEVAPYFSYTNHLVGLDYVVINTDRLEGMTPEEREVFDREWLAAMDHFVDLWSGSTQDAIDQATEGGATFLEIDNAPFIERLQPLREQFLVTDSQQELAAHVDQITEGVRSGAIEGTAQGGATGATTDSTE